MCGYGLDRAGSGKVHSGSIECGEILDSLKTG